MFSFFYHYHTTIEHVQIYLGQKLPGGKDITGAAQGIAKLWTQYRYDTCYKSNVLKNIIAIQIGKIGVDNVRNPLLNM